MPPCRETLWKAVDGFLLSLYAAAGGFTTSNRLSPGRRSQDFDPCSLCGERRTRGGKGIIKDTFQFTLSLRRATVLLSSPPVMWQRFQSTLSLRRATVGGCRYFCIIKNFNPRSPHGERHFVVYRCSICGRISIHALLTESDSTPAAPMQGDPAISIHALLTESDAALFLLSQQVAISIHALLTESDPPLMRTLNHRTFQSTLSSRRATRPSTLRTVSVRFQSTLSSWRATDDARVGGIWAHISIHALLMESDPAARDIRGGIEGFQSTLSSWRATPPPVLCCNYHITFQSTLSSWRATSPRTLRTVRVRFQSTLSSWRATSM